MTPVSSGHGIPSRTLTAKEKKIFVLKDLEVRYNKRQEERFYGRMELIWVDGHIVRIETHLSETPE